MRFELCSVYPLSMYNVDEIDRRSLETFDCRLEPTRRQQIVEKTFRHPHFRTSHLVSSQSRRFVDTDKTNGKIEADKIGAEQMASGVNFTFHDDFSKKLGLLVRIFKMVQLF